MIGPRAKLIVTIGHVDGINRFGHNGDGNRPGNVNSVDSNSVRFATYQL